MWQLAGFFAGYLVLVVLALRGRSAVAAIASMIGVYALFSWVMMGFGPLWSSLIGLSRWSDFRVFVYMFLSLLLAGVLRETGYLDLLVRGSASVGCRFSYVAVPSVIGLIPMPGGALVSAMAMKKKYIDESGMNPEWATFINYWFRHIWVPAWPIFQSVMITAAVLGVAPEDIVSVTWPETIAAIVAGLVVGYPAFKRYGCKRGSDSPLLFVRAVWPLALLALLVFVARINLLLSLVIVLALTTVLLRVNIKQMHEALKLASSPKVHAVLLEALLLKNLLMSSNAPQAFFEAISATSLPVEAIVAIIPLILGLAAGGENFFASTAIPLLVSYIAPSGRINPAMLLLAYAGGSMGVMMSPVHLCFALTVDYFKANPAKSLLLAVAASLSTIAMVFLLVIFAY